MSNGKIGKIFSLFQRKSEAETSASSKTVSQKNNSPTTKSTTNQSSYNDVSGQPYLPKNGKTHRVAGVSHHEKNVMSLASLNPYYELGKEDIIKNGYSDITIYKYSFQTEPVTLEQEPNNPYDPNAIKVMVAGNHIGYIKAGSCAQVNKLINNNLIQNITCRISGGPYKRVQKDVDLDNAAKCDYYFDKGTDDLRAEIRVVAAKE